MITAEEARSYSKTHSRWLKERKMKDQHDFEGLIHHFMNRYISENIKHNSMERGRNTTHITSAEIKNFLRGQGFSFFVCTRHTQVWRVNRRGRERFGIDRLYNHPVDIVFKGLKPKLESLGFQVGEIPRQETLTGFQVKQGWNSALHIDW